MISNFEILLVTAGWLGAYAILAAATGHLLGACRDDTANDDLFFACVAAPVGVLYAPGKYMHDRAVSGREIAEIERARAQEVAAAEHKVRLAALGRQAEDVARI